MTDMTIEEYYEQVDEQVKKYPAWRYGQTLFNVLYDVRPDLSEQVRASNIDPFYDSNIDEFKIWIEENW